MKVALPRKLLDVLERKCNSKNIIRETPVHRYTCLPAFSHMAELLNPGSSYSIMVHQINGSFVYYFLAFGAYIMGYAHMRKVIIVDDTYLYGKYGGVLLSAVAQDTENHIFPITFCVVDKENDASWTFFFQKLKSIVEDELDLRVFSDRHINIANAFSRVYSRSHYELCMRHLAENLRINQHCGEHLYPFYAAAKTYTVDEFSEHFAELKNNIPKATHILENVLGFEKWRRAHFPGNRYNVMTTNIAESLNSVLMDKREERHAFVAGQNNKFVLCAERILRYNKSASDFLYVTNANGGLDQFTVFGNALRAKYGDSVGYGNSIYEYSSLIYKLKLTSSRTQKLLTLSLQRSNGTVPQEVQDSKISPPPTIANSERKTSNALRASVRHSSPKGEIGVRYARNSSTKEPHVEWPTNHR
ncbi:hypothetical protein P3L10_003002 [Capsicum annuum]